MKTNKFHSKAFLGLVKAEALGAEPEERAQMYELYELTEDEIGGIESEMVTPRKSRNYFVRLWNKRYLDLIEFRKEHPDRWPNKRKFDARERELGYWVYWQRRQKRLGILWIEREYRLNRIGFVWDVLEELWQQNYANLLEFMDKFGHFPKYYDEYPDDEKLGVWCHCQRRNYRNGLISKEHCVLLEKAGISWQPFEERWYNHYEEYVKFKAQNPDRLPLVKSRNAKEKSIGEWIDDQRRRHRKGELEKERVALLEKVGVVWWPSSQSHKARTNVTHNKQWLRQYKILKRFRKKYPRKWPRQVEKFPAGNALGSWCNAQRIKFKKNLFYKEHLRLLKEIGFPFPK